MGGKAVARSDSSSVEYWDYSTSLEGVNNLNTPEPGKPEREKDFGGPDVITGSPFNDTLSGMGGADTISGGAGNDTMLGGPGDDTYLFKPGDGLDTIMSDEAQGKDTLLFGGGITQDDLYVQKSGNDLVVRVGVGGEKITVQNWFADNAPKAVDVVQLEGGDAIDLKGFLEGRDVPENGVKQTIRRRQKELTGGDGDDKLVGLSRRKKDTLVGGKGDDTLLGKVGNDKLKGGWGNDVLDGGAGNDVLDGGKGNDVLKGGKGDDRLKGGKGDDTLFGGKGKDKLTGGAGKDVFVFNVKLKEDNADKITDFTSGEDTIRLKKSIVSNLKTGVLKKRNFAKNADGQALDRNDFIVYNASTGALLYDADGNGSGAAVEIATLTKKPQNLSAKDIFIKK